MTHPVLQLEEKRRLAMEAADLEVLKELCDPAMIYRHGTGGVDDLDAYLGKLETKDAIYSNVRFENLSVITPNQNHHLLAVVMGNMFADIMRTNGPGKVKSHFQTTWHFVDGHWKLLAVHSAPVNV
jgi:hypothetical protein